MSTELTALSKPASAFQQAFGAVPQDSLADGIGSGYGVLSYKGKVWSLRYKGQSYIFARPDDGTPSPFIDVIILRSPPTKSKSYYAKYDPNSSGERPICSSLDGVVPDADVQQRQAEFCAMCPKNVWYTNAEGRKTRDCTDYKRLAVLLMPDVTKKMLGQELQEPVFLRIPPASLTDLANFGQRMEKSGFHHISYITRISFDPTQPHPKMVFKEHAALTDAEAPLLFKLREDSLTLRITGEDKVTNISGAAQITHSAAPAQIAPPPAAGPLFTSPTPAAPPPSTSGTITAPAPQVSDVGETTESDSELDKQINALLNA